MKKILVLVLVLGLLCSCMVGCTSDKPAGTTQNASTGSAASSASEVETASADTGDAGFVSTLAGKGVKADGTPYKVGLMYADLESDYIIYQSEYMKYMLEAAGCEVTIVNSEQNTEKESGYVDDFIQSGVDCVCTTAVDSNGSTASMNKLTNAGIALINIARGVEGASSDFIVGTSDNVQTGEKCMQYLADLANGEQVSIMSYQGYMGAEDAYLREEGYENVLAQNPNITYKAYPCNWTSTESQAAVLDELTVNPDLWGIVGHCDAMVPGVAAALKQSNKLIPTGEPGHIFWVSIDGASVALENIRAGYMDAVIDQSPLANAVICVKAILEHLVKGESGNGQKLVVETSVVTAENVDSPALWGNYDINDTETGIDWAGTEDVWNSCGI